MHLPLVLAFLFFIGSVCGWVLELIYRHSFSDVNPEHKWINPGFCVGPYVPLYGFGLCIVFLLATVEQTLGMNKIVMFVLMAACMTLIEYLAGLLALKWLNLRLWDYTNEWGNLQGLICPKFSFYWAVCSAGYYFLIHPHILEALRWLSENLAFSFFIGVFFGVFSIDVVYSSHLLVKIREFAKEKEVVVRYEGLKSYIRSIQEEQQGKKSFLFALRSGKPLREHLAQTKQEWETHIFRKQ